MNVAAWQVTLRESTSRQSAGVVTIPRDFVNSPSLTTPTPVGQILTSQPSHYFLE